MPMHVKKSKMHQNGLSVTLKELTGKSTVWTLNSNLRGPNLIPSFVAL